MDATPTNLGTAQVIRGDARHLPLADNTVDLVVTSPPYFSLRSYQDGGVHYDGQIGSEPTPAEFVAALLEVTAECVRVLKPSGSLWVNLGDKYAGGGGQWDKDEREDPGGRRSSKTTGGIRSANTGGKTYGLRAKSLIGIPWRYALACIDQLGLILRAELIWSKPNGLPESVTDRVRRSHEQWFHFTLEPRYFSAVDEIREAHNDKAGPPSRFGKITQSGESRSDGVSRAQTFKPSERVYNPLGKLPGSVWTVPTEPLTVPDHLGIDHFAAFPAEWPRRIIQGWSPAGVCVACGEGRRPVTETSEEYRAHRASVGDWNSDRYTPGEGYAEKAWRVNKNAVRFPDANRTISGYACACTPTHVERVPSNRVNRDPRGYDEVLVYDWHLWTPADTTPAVILDPFGGTGTVAMVAKALGRHGITIDMSNDYSRLATWRTGDRNQLAKVLGIAKTPAPDLEQYDLFGEVTG